MKNIIFCMLIFASCAFAEMDKTQIDLFKKESASLGATIDDTVNTIVQGRGLAESAKATYLEGYGAVFTLEALIGPIRSPFTSQKSPAEARSIVNTQRKALETKLEELLKQRAGTLQSVAATDSVTIVLYLFNSNPVDVPDLPSQIVFTAKKQAPSQVIVRPF